MSNISNELREIAFLFISGELSKQENSEFELEVSSNDELKQFVDELQKTVEVSETAFSFTPTDEQLQSQRLLLKGQLLQLDANQKTHSEFHFISRLKQFLTSPQPAWAVISYMVIAIVISRFVPLNEMTVISPSQNMSVNVMDLLRTDELKNIKLVSDASNGDGLHFALKTEKSIDVKGGLNDPDIQSLLFYLLLNDENPGKRMKAVKLLQDSAPQLDAQSVLVSALLTDPNPGVRLRSIGILKQYEPTELIMDASIKVLLEDENEAVRQKALEIIATQPQERSIPVLQIVSVMDDNEFIRSQAASALDIIEGSIDLEKIEVK